MTTTNLTWNPEATCAPNEVGVRLEVQFVEGLLEVVERAVGTTGTRTYVWKYDLAAKLRSTSGRASEKPATPMSEHEVEWVTSRRVPLAANAADQVVAVAAEQLEEVAA